MDPKERKHQRLSPSFNSLHICPGGGSWGSWGHGEGGGGGGGDSSLMVQTIYIVHVSPMGSGTTFLRTFARKFSSR